MRASQFYTREKHEEGVKVFLTLPDGTETTEFVVIQGSHSKAFRKAQSAYRTKMVEASAEGKEFDSLVEGAKLTASTIKSWSLEDELTEDSALKLLEEAPYLVDLLDSKIFGAKSFFGGTE